MIHAAQILVAPSILYLCTIYGQFSCSVPFLHGSPYASNTRGCIRQRLATGTVVLMSQPSQLILSRCRLVLLRDQIKILSVHNLYTTRSSVYWTL